MCISKTILASCFLKHGLGTYRRKSHALASKRMYDGLFEFSDILGLVRWATFSTYGEDSCPVFKPRRVAVLTKMTRYEYERERIRHQGLSEEEFKAYVSRGFCHYSATVF